MLRMSGLTGMRARMSRSRSMPGAISISSRPSPSCSLNTALSVTYRISRPFADEAAKVLPATWALNFEERPSCKISSIPPLTRTCKAWGQILCFREEDEGVFFSGICHDPSNIQDSMHQHYSLPCTFERQDACRDQTVA